MESEIAKHEKRHKKEVEKHSKMIFNAIKSKIEKEHQVSLKGVEVKIDWDSILKMMQDPMVKEFERLFVNIEPRTEEDKILEEKLRNVLLYGNPEGLKNE